METERDQLRKAALALYFSAYWTADRLSFDHQQELWEDLRLALDLPSGASTAALGKKREG